MNKVQSRSDVRSATRRQVDSTASVNMERRLRYLARRARRFALTHLGAALIALAATAFGTPALAQSTVTLVTNAGESGVTEVSSADFAQGFTTGPNAGGYKLTAVEIDYDDTEGDPISVSVCTVDGSGNPTTTCTGFTAPANFAVGTLVFTGSVELAASTDYAVRVGKSSADVSLGATTSTNQTSSHGWRSQSGRNGAEPGAPWRACGAPVTRRPWGPNPTSSQRADWRSTLATASDWAQVEAC